MFEILIATTGFFAVGTWRKALATPVTRPFTQEFRTLLTSLLAHPIISCGGVNRALSEGFLIITTNMSFTSFKNQFRLIRMRDAYTNIIRRQATEKDKSIPTFFQVAS